MTTTSLPGITPGPCGTVLRVSLDDGWRWEQRCELPHGHDGTHMAGRWQAAQ